MHLFAYGTLMTSVTSRLGTAQRIRLLRQSTPLGSATITAKLYDLGRYPGLVLTEDPGMVAHGELFQLTDPAASLRWLDAYEGIVPGDHEHNEYERRISTCHHHQRRRARRLGLRLARQPAHSPAYSRRSLASRIALN